MPKVETTYSYKIQSIVKEFPDEFMESINNYIAIDLFPPSSGGAICC